MRGFPGFSSTRRGAAPGGSGTGPPGPIENEKERGGREAEGS